MIRDEIEKEVQAALDEMKECRNDECYETMAKGVLALCQAQKELPAPAPSFKEWLAATKGDTVLEVLANGALTLIVLGFEQDGTILGSSAWRFLPRVHQRK